MFLELLYILSWFVHSQAVQYLTHLLGHEGPGSLLSLLRKKNWVNKLSSWSSTCGRGSAEFRVEVDLSVEGWEHQDEIVEHIFQVWHSIFPHLHFICFLLFAVHFSISNC